MRLGLTNLAWDPSRDEAVAGLLARLGMDAIDVAPSKYFADVAAVREAEVRRVRDWWADRGIEITGMQSLLYGTQGLNLFGPLDVQQRMLAYLAAVCRVGAWLGATRLVFGSPANRNRAGLTDAEAWARALEFFGRLAEVAADAGVTICLEGVHPHYGANFMTDTASSLRMAQALNHPSVGIVLEMARTSRCCWPRARPGCGISMPARRTWCRWGSLPARGSRECSQECSQECRRGIFQRRSIMPPWRRRSVAGCRTGWCAWRFLQEGMICILQTSSSRWHLRGDITDR